MCLYSQKITGLSKELFMRLLKEKFHYHQGFFFLQYKNKKKIDSSHCQKNFTGNKYNHLAHCKFEGRSCIEK